MDSLIGLKILSFTPINKKNVLYFIGFLFQFHDQNQAESESWDLDFFDLNYFEHVRFWDFYFEHVRFWDLDERRLEK